MEERLSPPQFRGIFPRLRRDWTTRNDATGGSEIRYVLPLLLDRSAERADHAVRAAASVPFALPNRMAGAARDPAKGPRWRPNLESISRLRSEHGRVCDPGRRAGGDRFLQPGA